MQLIRKRKNANQWFLCAIGLALIPPHLVGKTWTEPMDEYIPSHRSSITFNDYSVHFLLIIFPEPITMLRVTAVDLILYFPFTPIFSDSSKFYVMNIYFSIIMRNNLEHLHQGDRS